MKATRVSYFDLGPHLTLIFATLILLILGGNCLLIWQFQTVRLQTRRLAGVSQLMIAILRYQESLLSFHERLDAAARSKDAQRLDAEAEPLRRALVEQIQQTKSVLAHLPSESRIDPNLLPTLEAVDVTLPSEVESVIGLAHANDWDTLRLRLDNDMRPLERQTSELVNNVDQNVNSELTSALANITNVQRRIFVIVPLTALSTFFVATFLGWSIARRIIELRLDERIEERLRITRELHDTFLQTVQGSKLVADDALEHLSDPVRTRHALERLSEWLGLATQEGRAALHSLRASSTETNDLAASLRQALDDCRGSGTSIEAHFLVTGDPREMHPIVRDEVYRIGYEAIRNAFTHSAGSRIDVGLSYGEDLSLRVRDNGVGIGLAAEEPGKNGHFGLQGMHERAARIRAQLTIISSNLGTEVKVVVPGQIVFRSPLAKPFDKLKMMLKHGDNG